jgi:tetratricopeptide (TPR) repeat protein
MDKNRILQSLWILLLCGCAASNVTSDVQAGRFALLRGDPGAALTHLQRAVQSDPNYVADFHDLQESAWTYLGRAHYGLDNLSEAQQAFERALTLNKTDSIARLYLGLTMLRLPEGKRAQTGLTLDDVLFALKEGVAPRRVTALVAEKGVEFELTSESENHLRRAGADSQLLQKIKTTREEYKTKRAPVASKERGLIELGTAMKEIQKWLDYKIAYAAEGHLWDPGSRIRNGIQSSIALLGKDANPQKLISAGEWIGRELEEESERVRRSDLKRRLEDLRLN